MTASQTNVTSSRSAAAKVRGAGLLARIGGSRRIQRALPQWLKTLLWRLVDRGAVEANIWAAANPFANDPDESTYPARVDVRIGIVREVTHLHHHFIAACRDLGVPYRLVDILQPDWRSAIERSECDAFLVRPSVHRAHWKDLYDRRIRVMTEEMGKVVYPEPECLYFYESKRRVYQWLDEHGFVQPRTWIFDDRDAALALAGEADLPIVCKSDLGSSSSGVWIFRKRRKLLGHVRRSFAAGVARRGCDPRDRQRGCVIFQEYLPGIEEWRVMRIGDSYIGYQKLPIGQFHSGSLLWAWRCPPMEMFDTTRRITEAGGFTSLSVDFVRCQDGRTLVTELHAYVGTSWEPPISARAASNPMGIDQEAQNLGRYIYDDTNNDWVFQHGVFWLNNTCNLRVEALLKQLGAHIYPERPEVESPNGEIVTEPSKGHS
ncbi:MAG TPA: hypothetical protein ENH80_05500 [Phycisphaerae bacterium]|nr:hypothetical protein [Phycisphaerae bacterium]HDZ43382.1 hypothetical protein [Phycisphaerae bacterium]